MSCHEQIAGPKVIRWVLLFILLEIGFALGVANA